MAATRAQKLKKVMCVSAKGVYGPCLLLRKLPSQDTPTRVH